MNQRKVHLTASSVIPVTMTENIYVKHRPCVCISMLLCLCHRDGERNRGRICGNEREQTSTEEKKLTKSVVLKFVSLKLCFPSSAFALA